MNYLSEKYKVLSKKFLGEISWNDVAQFESGFGHKVNGDSCRKNAVDLRDFLKGGWILSPPKGLCADSQEETASSVLNAHSQNSYDGKTGIFSSSSTIEIRDGENITPELMIEKHGLKPSEWDIISYTNNAWNSQVKDGELITLYQSKISVKPKKQKLDYDYIKDSLKDYKPNVFQPVSKKKYTLGDDLLVPCFYDVHFGKLGWHEEVGEGGNYDLKIAKHRFLENSKSLLNKIQGRSFEKILYVIGQDFIHSEPNGKTINDTEQDCDGRYQEIFKVACEALIDSISSFAQIAPVEVVLVQGNHSETSEFFMAEYLKAYFRQDKNITVDSSPMLRKYYRFHNTLLGLSHGEYEGKRITELMPVEAREDWGQTEYHEFLLGHLHSESSFEKGGITVRRIPSICGTDAWSKKMGYCTSPKRSVAFVYNKVDGLTDTMYQPIH